MVKLSYAFKLKAPFEEVWAYFSRFESIAEYDPCVKAAVVMNPEKKDLGRKFDITTLHHGKEGNMVYECTKYLEQHESTLRNFMVEVHGTNQKIVSTDCISVRQIPKGEEDFNLILEYKADLGLRGIYWLKTPFITSTFKQIALNAEQKCYGKCREKWGKENVRNLTNH